MAKFTELDFCLRSSAEHLRQCQLLEREDLSSSEKQHYSTTYGVNRRAEIDKLLFFDVTSGALIPDIMHDILEGALPLELKLMLKVNPVLLWVLLTSAIHCIVGIGCGTEDVHSTRN